MMAHSTTRAELAQRESAMNPGERMTKQPVEYVYQAAIVAAAILLVLTAA